MTRTKTYEVMLLLDNREVKKGWDSLKEQVDGVLTKHGAKIVVAKRWDERKLAYEIKKQRRATYYLSYLESDPNTLDELERSLRLSAPVLRHLVLACEEIPGEAYEAEREFDLDKADDDSATSAKASEESASEGETADGETAEGETAEGETAEGETGESQSADASEAKSEEPDSTSETEKE